MYYPYPIPYRVMTQKLSTIRGLVDMVYLTLRDAFYSLVYSMTYKAHYNSLVYIIYVIRRWIGGAVDKNWHDLCLTVQ